MRFLAALIIISLCFIISCGGEKSEKVQEENTAIDYSSMNEIKVSKDFDIQGHRGARGILPENSIPAFERAIELGVNTLELDVVITQDKKVVVSHEPWISAEICLGSNGEVLDRAKEKELNIYQMDYNQVKTFNCGSLMVERFKNQGKVQTYKPLLEEVFRKMAKFQTENEYPTPAFNIEIKSSPEGDNVFHPEPNEFSDLVFQVIDGNIPWERVTIQSFDPRILKYFNSKYPEVVLAYLEESSRDWETLLDDLGFEPEIYSCYFELLDQASVAEIQSKGIKVIPWTVNEKQDMIKLASWGVDGLITDYPNIALESFTRTE